MLLRIILPVCLFIYLSPLSAFIIVNQTKEERVLVIDEAYRPSSGNLNHTLSPVSMGYKPLKVKLQPQSVREIELRSNCSVLLVGVETKEKKKKGKSTKTTYNTCYEPYPYGGEDFTEITDEWGLLIYKPEDLPAIPSYRDHNAHYVRTRAIEQGYGIKCLHPQLVEGVDPKGSLPEIFTSTSESNNTPFEVWKS